MFIPNFPSQLPFLMILIGKYGLFNTLPHEPQSTWDTEAFFCIFEGLRRNYTTIIWEVLCPKHLLVIEGNYHLSKKIV
jgi:hypothetical protein